MKGEAAEHCVASRFTDLSVPAHKITSDCPINVNSMWPETFTVTACNEVLCGLSVVSV